MDDLVKALTKSNSGGKKGCSKAGRNKVFCAYYRKARYFNNKIRKLKKHIAKYPNDLNAKAAVDRLYARVMAA